jgi:hypothetical protein
MKDRPTLDKILGRKAAPARRQSWQEQKAVLSAWAAVTDPQPTRGNPKPTK